MLSQFCGFQQKAAATIMDALEGGERRLVVGGEFCKDGHKVALCG